MTGSDEVLDHEKQARSGRGLGLATRVQVTAHQFMARRASLAMTRRSVRMETEPGRRQTMAIGASITATVVICAGALFWSFIKPAGSAGNDTILADQNSGELYVRVGDTLHPALNLGSARLIAGSADNPKRVRRSEIEKYRRGPEVGIPGVPSHLETVTPATSTWLVCDTVTKAHGKHAPEPVTTTVINGRPDLDERRRVLGPNQGVLLSHDGATWLIRDGRRSRVDVAQRPVLLALGLPANSLTTARPMSRALFDAIPVGPPLAVPAIPGAGGDPRFPGAPGKVGTVVSTPQVGGQTQYLVVLADGLQTVSPVAAQALHNAGGRGAAIPVVAGPTLADMPVVSWLDLSMFPDEPLEIVDTQQNPSTCWMWQRHVGEPLASTSMVSGSLLPIPQADLGKIVEFVKPDKTAVEADRVFFGPDYTNFVVSTGNAPGSATQEALWFIRETGVRYGIDRDPDTQQALGLAGQPGPAPWAALRLLAAGPALSRADALLRHDSLPVNLSPGKLEPQR